MVSGIYCKTFPGLAYLISAEGEEHSEITHITRHRVDHLIRLMLVGMLCVGVIDNLLFFLLYLHGQSFNQTHKN